MRGPCRPGRDRRHRLHAHGVRMAATWRELMDAALSRALGPAARDLGTCGAPVPDAGQDGAMRWWRGKTPDVVTGTSLETADWLVEGAGVVHAKFGTGTIVHAGEYKAMPGVWIDFDAGMRKLLDIQHALPHLRPRRPQDTATPAD